MLSNDNEEGGNPDTMELSEEVITTPTTHIAVTPAASPKPPAQSTSDKPASHGKNNSKMSQMSKKFETSKNVEVLEE